MIKMQALKISKGNYDLAVALVPDIVSALPKNVYGDYVVTNVFMPMNVLLGEDKVRVTAGITNIWQKSDTFEEHYKPLNDIRDHTRLFDVVFK